MDTARCFRCGFTMRGRFVKGPPAACPACGFTRSAEVLARINAEKADAVAYAQKGFWGRLAHRVRRALKPKPEPIV